MEIPIPDEVPGDLKLAGETVATNMSNSQDSRNELPKVLRTGNIGVLEQEIWSGMNG